MSVPLLVTDATHGLHLQLAGVPVVPVAELARLEHVLPPAVAGELVTNPPAGVTRRGEAGPTRSPLHARPSPAKLPPAFAPPWLPRTPGMTLNLYPAHETLDPRLSLSLRHTRPPVLSPAFLGVCRSSGWTLPTSPGSPFAFPKTQLSSLFLQVAIPDPLRVPQSPPHVAITVLLSVDCEHVSLPFSL